MTTAILGMALVAHPLLAGERLKSGYEGKVTYTTFDVPSTNPGKIKESLSRAKKKKGLTYLALPNQKKFSPPFPLVLVLPGSGGIKDNTKYYAKEFRKLGFASAIVDPYKPRGMKSLGTSQSGMSDASYVMDIFLAMEKLAEHPDLDMNRVAAFGRSWGGGIQMYLVSKWWTDQIGKGKNPIKFYVVLYPACYLTEENVQPSGGEMLVLFGLKDDWDDPEPCRRYLDRLRDSGAKIKVVDFPEGHHGFDGGYGVKTREYVTYHCEAVWDNITMVLTDKQTGKNFNLKGKGWEEFWDSTDCIKKETVHVGGTRNQRERTLEIVTEYLSEKLKQDKNVFDNGGDL